MSYIEPIPERIQELLQSEGIAATSITVAFKTALKLNATIPTLWLIATHDEIILCSTHRTRGLWKRLHHGEIGAVRSELTLIGAISLRLIYCSLDEPDLILPLPKEMTTDKVQKCLSLLSF